MTSSEDDLLARTANLDRDLVLTLAQTYEGAARALQGRVEGWEQPVWEARSDTLIDWETGGAGGRPPRDAAEIHSASLYVASAAYWLLLQNVDAARRCYGKAASSTALGPDDRYVLSSCLGQSAFPRGEPMAEYSAAMARLASSANDVQRPDVPRPTVPTLSTPVLGIEAQDLLVLAENLEELPRADVRDSSASSRRAQADARFRAVLDRSARPIELAQSDWRWAGQVGSLLPIEPELLSLGMIYVSWHLRQRGRLPRTRPGSTGLHIRAAALLLARGREHDGRD